jgi:hypothetical protein
MTKKEAINLILSDTPHHDTSLNYAVNYCKSSLTMPEGSEAFDRQVLYILGNIKSWRHPMAKAVRDALKSK